MTVQEMVLKSQLLSTIIVDGYDADKIRRGGHNPPKRRQNGHEYEVDPGHM